MSPPQYDNSHPKITSRFVLGLATPAAQGRRSAAKRVAEINHTALKLTHGQEVELDAGIARQCVLAATDDDRVQKQVTLVDQTCGNGLASEFGSAHGDVTIRRSLELPDHRGVEVALDPRPLARYVLKCPRVNDLVCRSPDLREVVS